MNNFHQPPVETTFFSTATAKHRTETTTTTTTTTKLPPFFKKHRDRVLHKSRWNRQKDLKLNFVKGEVSETALKEALATEAGWFPATKNPWKTWHFFAALKKKGRFSRCFLEGGFFEWFQILLFCFVLVLVLFGWFVYGLYRGKSPSFTTILEIFRIFFQPSNMQILKLLWSNLRLWTLWGREAKPKFWKRSSEDIEDNPNICLEYVFLGGNYLVYYVPGVW